MTLVSRTRRRGEQAMGESGGAMTSGIVLPSGIRATGGGTQSPASQRVSSPGQWSGTPLTDYLGPYQPAWLPSSGFAGPQKAERATVSLTDNVSAVL